MVTKKRKVVYLVEDCENAPGRILALFHDCEDAARFINALGESARIEERTVWYGQPVDRGYNK